MSDLLRAGASKIRITPPLGTRMAGYRARREGATSVHDDLYARCLALESAEERFALLSLDVMGVEDAWVDELRARVGESLDVPGAHLLVAATHTHAAQGGLFRSEGPVGRAFDTMMGDGAARFDDASRARLLEQADEAVRAAFARLEPASLAAGSAKATGIAANRLHPDRTVDETCLVLEIRSDADERTIALVVHFTCHPTTLGEADLGLSGDFPGVASQLLERGLGGDAVALYLNGALGDVSTRFTRRSQTYSEVERFAEILAEAALEALAQTEPLEAAFAAAERVVELPPRAAGWVDRVAGRAGQLAGAESPAERRQLSTALEGLESASRSADVVAGLPSVPIRLQALALSPRLALLAVPGEPFSSFAAQLSVAEGQTVAVVAPANGYPGYLPDAEAYDEGGYEVGCSLFDRGAAEELARVGSELVASLAPTEARA
ncbi:MAG: hypothetical protein QOK32_1333 [Gaiellaceae bacterium]|jgi:hypothetical protein|nr:hypothetical protein [Gaiellaceae bacterium]